MKNLTSFIYAAIAAGILGIATPGAAQEVSAYIVVDTYSKKILSEFNARKELPVASLTKLATIAVAVDWAERSGAGLNVTMTVPQSAAALAGTNPVGMIPGDRITLKNAMYACLLGSDNVSAETIADHVGSDLIRRTGKSEEPVPFFVEQMNALAHRLKMKNTKFRNPHGLDHIYRSDLPKSTAADMARLAIAVSEKPEVTFMASQKSRKIGYGRQGRHLNFLLKNTNKVVGQAGVDGLKTGTTRAAGSCLILTAKQNATVKETSDGRKIIYPRRQVVVVLGSVDRFGMGMNFSQRGWGALNQWNAGGRQVTSPDDLLTTF